MSSDGKIKGYTRELLTGPHGPELVLKLPLKSPAAGLLIRVSFGPLLVGLLVSFCVLGTRYWTWAIAGIVASVALLIVLALLSTRRRVKEVRLDGWLRIAGESVAAVEDIESFETRKVVTKNQLGHTVGTDWEVRALLQSGGRPVLFTFSSPDTAQWVTTSLTIGLDARRDYAGKFAAAPKTAGWP